jgi:anaerobic selenocysteine-containing dehydrogenase
MPQFASMCRNCTAYCPIVVTVEDGRPIKVVGDREAPAFGGYTCPKGRELPAQHGHPDRVLDCRARDSAGAWHPVESGEAIGRIAARIDAIRLQHGPRSVAVYYGTGNVTNCNGSAMARAWMSAIGSRMMFSAMAIDKPAANVSLALHGNWHAGTHPFEVSDTWMIVGANPVIAKSNGAPFNNPGLRLKEAANAGMNLIVIDPRRTETSQRAKLHLRPLPGQDAAILAAMIRIIIAEQLYDADFVAGNARGLAELTEAVAPFTTAHAAARAGLAQEEIIAAARLFAAGTRGGVVCATGPSFSTDSNLTFYLGLCLNTLCGRWVRAGETAPYPNVLLPAFTPRAQPYAPYPAVGSFPMRVHGLHDAASGLPTAALADEILEPGEGQVRALIVMGGNPMLSWPDQRKVERALRSLDLLVVLDHQMTPTARMADYVFGIPLGLETAGSTTRIEALKYVGASRGYSFPWAQYTDKIVDAPPGSDLVEDAEFFFRLGQAMGLQLNWTNSYGFGPHVETPPQVTPLDMSRVPTTEELLELTCNQSRVPLADVRRHPHGHVFPIEVIVEPRASDCDALLELADETMMRDLARVACIASAPDPDELLLVSRRINTVMNSVGHGIAALGRGMDYAPAYLHPDDLGDRGLSAGDLVVLRSRSGEMIARVEGDDTLRRGIVAVIHGFDQALADDDPTARSRSVTALIDMSERDPISGIPRMSALPIRMEKYVPSAGSAIGNVL